MNNLVYVTHELLARDVRLLVKNAQTYNRSQDPVYKQSMWISENFEKYYEKVAKELDDARAARKKERERLKKLEKLKQQGKKRNTDTLGKLYLRQPKSRRLPGVPEGYLVDVLRSVYGLPDAPRAWWEEFTGFLLSLGFTHSRIDVAFHVFTTLMVTLV